MPTRSGANIFTASAVSITNGEKDGRLTNDEEVSIEPPTDRESVQLLSLRGLVNEGSRCLIVLKARKGFTTDLAGLRQSCGPSTFPVLLTSDRVFCKLTKAQRDEFFLVLTYALLADEKKSRCWFDLTEVSYSEVAPKLHLVLGYVPADRCLLVVSEEPLVHFAASLRRRFQIPGAQPDDIRRFTNKVTMRQTLSHFEPADRLKVAPVKFCSISTGYAVGTGAQLENLLLDAGLTYPIVLKPRSSCGSFDVQVVGDQLDVYRWHSKHRHVCKPYIAEQFIASDQYAAYMLMFSGKIQWMRIFRNTRPIVAFVRDRLPLAKVELCQEDETYGTHCAYLSYLAAAFSPIPNGMFTVEYFRGSNGDFQFLENCVRLPGGPLVTLALLAEGINVEVAHLTAQCSAPSVIKEKERVWMAYVRFPTRRGVVASIRQPPSTLRSRVCALWRLQVGQQTEDPVELSGKYVALQLLLLNVDYGQLKADLATCTEEYQPFELLKD